MTPKTFLLLFLLMAHTFRASAQRPCSTASEEIRCEVRAVWLTTLSGLDWPRTPATTEAGTRKQQKELCEMLDRLQAVGINTVLFQSRIRGTTAYVSALEPWDGAFTGTIGKAPSYDPLAFVIEEAHKRGMELHAWVVAFPIGKVTALKQLGKRALPSLHPELCVKGGDQWMMDPGVPQTADYLAKVCKEIAENYDVDGIHLDYIRYPEAGISFNDDKTYQKYGSPQNKKAWRTENVNRCVRAIHDAVKSVRPWLKLSCSPVGKYSDLRSQTSYGWNARDAVCQDAQLWLREGWMDMLFPMMYYDGKHFYPFLLDWQDNKGNGMVCPGLGIYFLSEKEKDWPLLTIQRQMNVARSSGLDGQAFFRARFLLENVKGLYSWLSDDFYSSQALIPPMGQSPKETPPAPNVEQEIRGQHLSLTWQAVEDSTPVYYNVYRLDSLRGDRLLARHLEATCFETLLSLPALRHSQYVVTATDSYGNESLPGMAQKVVGLWEE